MVRYNYCPPKNLYTGCYYKLYDNPYYKVYLNNYTGSQTSDRYFASKMNRYYDRHEKLLSDKIEKNEHEEYRQYRDKIKIKLESVKGCNIKIMPYIVTN